jgi:hypothetical protein
MIHKQATQHGKHTCNSCKQTRFGYYATVKLYVEGTACTRIRSIKTVCNDCLSESQKASDAYNHNSMVQLAKQMIATGIPVNQVAEITKLAIEEITCISE